MRIIYGAILLVVSSIIHAQSVPPRKTLRSYF
jgi:hypothetical protein